MDDFVINLLESMHSTWSVKRCSMENKQEKIAKWEKLNMYGKPYRKAQKDHPNGSLPGLAGDISWMCIAK